MSGNFDVACEILGDVKDHADLTRAEWRLKHRALSSVMAMTSHTSQNRQPRAADDGLRANEEPSPDVLWGLLNLDMLHPEVLFRLGDAAWAAGKPALDLHLLSALIEPTMPVAWLRCLGDAAAEEPGLLNDVAVCARRWVGDDLIDMLHEDARSAPLAPILQEHFESLEDKPQSLPVVRMVTGGCGEVVVVERLRHDVPPEEIPAQPLGDEDDASE